MPRKLLVAEKPAFARDFFHSPASKVTEWDAVFTMSLGWWRFAPDHTRTFSDIPFTSLPSLMHRFTDLNSRDRYRLYELDRDIKPYQNDLYPTPEALIGYLHSKCIDGTYDEVVILVDPDHTGGWGASQIVTALGVCGEMPVPVTVVRIVCFTAEALNKAFSTRAPWANSPIQQDISYAKVKRLFDYWFFTNSALVFGELLKQLELNNSKILSKYELMATCILGQAQVDVSFGEFADRLAKWPGSGKFRPEQRIGIGSPMSLNYIIKQMLDRGTAHPLSESTIGLTPRGSALIDLLHPKTFDPDLPFRLHKWCSENDLEAAGRYIRQLFGRQLRYQRRHMA
ncbi:hypothetical protein [Marinobacterium sp. BA1]|uniref:hypothetical protein n=1 Tax=Marinobacterium sp. BA1 TaxID=3138931 RepID=UPI0032E6152C